MPELFAARAFFCLKTIGYLFGMSFSPSDGVSFWLKIAAIVALIILAVNFLRVNREEAQPNDRPTRVEYSYGAVAEGHFTIPEGGELSYRILLNRTMLLKGDFASLSKQQPIEALVLDHENYKSRKAGGDWEPLARTGHIPGGRLNRELKPGEYWLVVAAQADSNVPVDVRLDMVLE